MTTKQKETLARNRKALALARKLGVQMYAVTRLRKYYIALYAKPTRNELKVYRALYGQTWKKPNPYRSIEVN